MSCVCVFGGRRRGVCVLVMDVSLFLFVVSQECLFFSHAVNHTHSLTRTRCRAFSAERSGREKKERREMKESRG